MRFLALVIWLLALFACGRESQHGDPPPGGWTNGATNAASFAGPANPQFNFKRDSGPSGQQDALAADLQEVPDAGGPITFDF